MHGTVKPLPASPAGAPLAALALRLAWRDLRGGFRGFGVFIACLALGVAAIAGQGPHVVQPIERINGKFVVFSSGNLLSDQSAAAGLPAETQYGLIALFRFRSDEKETKVKRLDYVPVWVRPGDYLIEPVGWGLKNDPANESALRAAWESTVSIAGKGRLIRPIPRTLGG